MASALLHGLLEGVAVTFAGDEAPVVRCAALGAFTTRLVPTFRTRTRAPAPARGARTFTVTAIPEHYVDGPRRRRELAQAGRTPSGAPPGASGSAPGGCPRPDLPRGRLRRAPRLLR